MACAADERGSFFDSLFSQPYRIPLRIRVEGKTKIDMVCRGYANPSIKCVSLLDRSLEIVHFNVNDNLRLTLRLKTNPGLSDAPSTRSE